MKKVPMDNGGFNVNIYSILYSEVKTWKVILFL